MIQRIQSVWLLLAAVAAFLTLQFPVFSGNIIDPGQPKIFRNLTATGNLLILAITVVTGALAGIAIFLYKNRKLQNRLTLFACFLSIINIVLYYLQAQKFVPAESGYGITALLALLVPVFLILAARGINRDRKLVKSLDRLR
ncbi:MAG: DUF4293 domain-containing protein [Bacteroidota bacterium]